MGQALDLSPGGEVYLRGTLGQGVSVNASTSVSQRLFVEGADSIRMVARCSGISATATATQLNVYGIRAPATFNDATGVRTSAVLVSATLANDVDGVLSVSLNGEQFIEVDISRNSSSGCVIGVVTVAAQKV